MVNEFQPRYPSAFVSRTSRKPLALLAATRFALRRAGVTATDMERFLADAAPAAEGPQSGEDTLESVCARWARIDDGKASKSDT
jgi:hypothetical protein